MTTTMLHRLGYAVLPALTPQETLRLAGQFTEVIHLLVTDVIMPESESRQLLESAALNEPDDNYHNRDHQQDMNESTHGI